MAVEVMFMCHISVKKRKFFDGKSLTQGKILDACMTVCHHAIKIVGPSTRYSGL